MVNKKSILITGITGFIGTQLQKVLVDSNYQIFGLLRQEKMQHIAFQKTKSITYLTLPDIEKNALYFDTIINLAGENIAGARWTKNRKNELKLSRVSLTEQLYQALSKKPKTFISMSAIGIYGTDNSQQFDESMEGEEGFACELCKEWEKAALHFAQSDARVCILRLGVVLGKGGALEKMLLPFKLGLGGKIGSGKQFFPWIHIDDVTRLILFLLEQEHLKGVFNAVAPQSITQQQFAQIFASVLHRPCVLTTPQWLLSLLFGEMSILLTSGVQVVPTRTLDAGFYFQYANIEKALKNIYFPE